MRFFSFGGRAAQLFTAFAKLHVWSVCCVMGALLFAAATQRHADAITINMEYTDEGDEPPHDENPSWDPSGVHLKAHFQAAKQIWERLLPGDEDYTFDFHWDNDIDGLGLATEGIDTYIEINPDYNYFADRTPNEAEEFSLTGTQKLFGQLTGAEQANFFPGTAPPGALETGYRRDGLATGVGAGGYDANDGFDLLTVVLHEIGHILGISGVEPGEYNIYPHHVGGLGNVLVLEDNDSGHLAGDDMVPGFLMCDTCATPGGRYYPTATDVLVIAEDQGITTVHLERVGSISSGVWSDASKWIGANVPDITQDAYIRHGGAVALNADQQARRLLVDGGSSVSVQTHQLIVEGTLNFDGATISVGAGGVIEADTISGDPATFTTTAGSLVRFNQFTRGASSATSASFNGSVTIGHDTLLSLPAVPLPVFDPNPISGWIIAEQLAIGEVNTVSTLAINNGVDFTSATGRIGTDFLGAGGIGNVNISGVGSSWRIGGALDARHGSLNVADQGLLTTGSVAIGANVGQMSAAVNNATWNVNGHVDVGPSTPTGFGFGRLTIQNGGRMTVSGNLNVHGTNENASQVTVESDGTLDVDGQVIVRPYGSVTFSDDTTSFNHSFTNIGSGDQYRLGGVTQFTGNATAGNSSFTNNGGTAIWGYGGETRFSGASSAEFATITNAGPSGLYAFHGKTVFLDSASAGNANITNLPSSGGPTMTDFYGTSTAASATIINRSGAYPTLAGVTTFHDNSTAGNGIFSNESNSGGTNGHFIFNDSSTAGQGTFTNGGPVSYGYVWFYDNSTAGEANIIVRGAGDSRVMFWENSSAGGATLDVGPIAFEPANVSNLAQFFGNSTAADSTITVRGDGGRALFYSNSTAGSATIVALGSTRPGNIGGTVPGQVLFDSYSTAGNATITAQPSSVAGAPGGWIVFLNGGRAGAATLIANGGATAVNGGLIRFQSAGNGDSARLVVNAGASADFSHNAFHGGTAVGSIEGAGRFSLGGSSLTVGNLNTSTTVSGNITDIGGLIAGTGGKLTKVGAGTLTLSGANTYTGLTTVDEGTLVVNGSIAAGAVVKDGGILKGIGSMGSVTVESGGVFAPGASPGTITVAGLNLMSGSTLEYELGAVRDRIVVTNNGSVTLGGLLDLSILAGFNPLPGQTFELFEGAIGSITGVFSAVNAPLFNGHTLDLVYGVNQVTLHVIDAVLPPGDYNQNGVVDAADYTVWRDTRDSMTNLTADGNNSGAVDAGDLNVWQANFGRALGSGANEAAAVPEPATSALLLIAGASAFCIAGYRRPYSKRKDGP
ncbi:MAG: autotransporter-associated beta strand repeat-containing protein [Pirellulales bacterium]